MADEKDRFGDKLRDAERGHEDSYFAKRDRELVEKIRGKTTAPNAAQMRCPKCGESLTPTTHHGVTVEQCEHCGGAWFDKHQLDKAARHEAPDWLARYLGRPR